MIFRRRASGASRPTDGSGLRSSIIIHPSAWRRCPRKSANVAGLGQAQKPCLGVAEPALRVEPAQVRLAVVKHEEAKRGFVLLSRTWVVERDFAWASRFRRLVKDYERLPDTVAGLHFVAFACLFLQQAAGILSAGS